jgi:hypothetical protein
VRLSPAAVCRSSRPWTVAYFPNCVSKRVIMLRRGRFWLASIQLAWRRRQVKWTRASPVSGRALPDFAQNQRDNPLPSSPPIPVRRYASRPILNAHCFCNAVRACRKI